MKKSESMRVRVSADERAQWGAAAEAQGLSTSEWLRCLLNEAAGIEHEPAPLGRKLDKEGYVLLRRPTHPMAGRDEYVREHRLVMAEAVGRMLRPEEVVHHMLPCEGGSGDITDNRIENLMLFASNREHAAHHQALRRQVVVS